MEVKRRFDITCVGCARRRWNKKMLKDIKEMFKDEDAIADCCGMIFGLAPFECIRWVEEVMGLLGISR
jgi:hypothetical protein